METSDRLARWNTTLQAYDIQFVHRKAANNKVPDALSGACENRSLATNINFSNTPALELQHTAAKVAAIGELIIEDPWYAKKIR